MGRGFQLLETNGRNWQLSKFLFVDDIALLSYLYRHCVNCNHNLVRCVRRKLRVNVSESNVMRCLRSDVACRIMVCLIFESNVVGRRKVFFIYNGSNLAEIEGMRLR